MVQQNKQTYQNFIRRRTKIGIREVVSSVSWDFKLDKGSIRYTYRVGSKQELAIRVFTTFLTIMVEKMIEEDVVYYCPKRTKKKFYISKLPKKFVRTYIKNCKADMTKIDTFYCVRFSQKRTNRQDYVVFLTPELTYKLDKAVENGKTYRDGIIE